MALLILTLAAACVAATSIRSADIFGQEPAGVLSASAGVTVDILYGGQRSSTCGVDVAVGYRDDSLGAPTTIAATLSTQDDAVVWSVSDLRNGWIVFAHLPGSDTLPTGTKLTLTPTGASAAVMPTIVSIPASDDCILQLANPDVRVVAAVSLPGASYIPVMVDVSTSDAGAAILASVAGSPEAPFFGAFVEPACGGGQTVTARSTKPGALDSNTVSATIWAAGDGGQATCTKASKRALNEDVLSMSAQRNAQCNVEVTVSFTIASGATATALKIVRVDNNGIETAAVLIAVANGFDTVLSLGKLDFGTDLQLQQQTSSGWTAVGPITTVPNKCTAQAAAPLVVAGETDYTALGGPSVSVTVTSAYASVPGAITYVTLDGTDPASTDVSRMSFTMSREVSISLQPLPSWLLREGASTSDVCVNINAATVAPDASISTTTSLMVCIPASGTDNLASCMASATACTSSYSGIACWPGDCSTTYYAFANGAPSALRTAPDGLMCARGALVPSAPSTCGALSPCDTGSCGASVAANPTGGEWWKSVTIAQRGNLRALAAADDGTCNQQSGMACRVDAAEQSVRDILQSNGGDATPCTLSYTICLSGYDSNQIYPLAGGVGCLGGNMYSLDSTTCAGDPVTPLPPTTSTSPSSSATAITPSSTASTSTTPSIAASPSSSASSTPSTSYSPSFTPSTSSSSSVTASGTPQPTLSPVPAGNNDISTDCNTDTGLVCAATPDEQSARDILTQQGIVASACTLSYALCADPSTIYSLAAGVGCWHGIFANLASDECAGAPAFSPSASSTPVSFSSSPSPSTSQLPPSSSPSIPQPSSTQAPPPLPDGLNCVISSAEAALRDQLASAFTDYTPSPCTLSFAWALNGVTFPEQSVAPGTACLNGAIVLDTDPACGTLGFPSATPSNLPSPSMSGLPSSSPGPSPPATPNIGDTVACATGDAFQTWQSPACVSGWSDLTLEYALPWDRACYTGATEGKIVAYNDPLCTGIATPTPDPRCGGSPLTCPSQCGEAIGVCSSDGVSYFSMPVAAGTLCYDPGNGATIVASTDPACAAAAPDTICSELPEGTAVCYDFASSSIADPSLCTDGFFLCMNSQPTAAFRSAPGTMCHNGDVVFASDPVCNQPPQDQVQHTVSFSLDIGGASGGVQPVASAGISQVLASLLTKPGSATVSQADVVIMQASASRLLRNAVRAVVSAGRHLAVLASAPLSIFYPATLPLPGVPIFTEPPSLGFGRTTIIVSVNVASLDAASYVSRTLKDVTTPDASTGVSPLTAALSSAGLHLVVHAASLPSSAPAGTDDPVSSARLSTAALGGVIAGVVAVIALVVVGIIIAPRLRKLRAESAPAQEETSAA